MSISNNLFYYATSELSQDAFICYLLSFAIKENEGNDRELTRCAIELLKSMEITDEEIFVTEIRRQYKKIDILVKVNGKYNIIIEDKTFTSQRNGQINRYKNILEKEGKTNIICVYYKIIEQSKPEANVINITRKNLLNIFRKYKTNDKIFNDYVEYLEWIDKDVNLYKTLPIKEWTGHSYKGFFTHLIEDNIIDITRDYGWGYVSNAKGGFMGLWWHWLRDSNNISANIGLKVEDFDKIYLQIENDIIAVKLTKLQTNNSQEIVNVRRKLYEYFKSEIPEFKKKAFRVGNHMTVGYIEYDENDYKEKILLLEKSMKNIENGAIKFN
ncbi:PD-(D/E)XK nuclease family protein [Clostridium baratii]|uniref:PD-(D/E)XK nuclease superfamily protein n=1 Tax=Clostridium nitritogenes TaxID=83340 RepID=A0ABP3X5M3_9CLOT|nr:PD-(D/E)XK nuclease family protein [Clostridium baratii]MDY3208606.1 PD-(D/E)XK nuclease family protein [Clostridium baratii]